MKVLYGKRQHVVMPAAFSDRLRGYASVHVDVGTGSGRLMLKRAAKNPYGFYIGMDTSVQGMCESAVKAAKREKKEALNNLLYIVAPIEALPEELEKIADDITVILPWGSLRDGIVKADGKVLGNLRRLGKPGSRLEVLVGYDERIEPHEMQKRRLPALSKEYLKALAPAYREAGIMIHGIQAVGNDELKLVDSDWAKKLAYGGERIMYRLHCMYV